MADEDVRLPGNAIDSNGSDVAGPAVAILRQLYLLPTSTELDKAGSASSLFGGPPQSVAVIEAGATALSKWWAAGLGASVLGGWGAFAAFWDEQGGASQRALILAAAIASAAVILAIGYIVGSDVRGRAAAAVATMEARTSVAETIMRLARGREEEGLAVTITPLQPRSVKYLKKPSADEDGWVAIAMQSKSDGSVRKFLLVKGAADEWAGSDEVQFVTA